MNPGDFVSDRTQHVGVHRGYQITLFASASYCCDALKLRGYRSETALKRAIDMKLKKMGVES